MTDPRIVMTIKKRKTRTWFDRRGKPHEKTTDFIVGVRKRSKQHKR